MESERVETNQSSATQQLERTPMMNELAPRTAHGLSESTGPKFPQALHAVAWTTAAAILVGLGTAVGKTNFAGADAALGLDALTSPPIDQTETVKGIAIILQVVVAVIVISVVARALVIGLIWAVGRIRRVKAPAFPQWIRQHIWSLALIILIADVSCINSEMFTLVRSAQNILFKTSGQIGPIWTHIIFEDDRDTATSYEFLFCLGFSAFVWLSWWLLKNRFTERTSRIAFSIYAVVQAASMLLGYARLEGIAGTVQDYPVVTFSGVEGLGKSVIPILLGQDDKMFAVLVVELNATSAQTSRYLLYLPRTEVKWMSIIRYMSLYQTEKISDLKQISKEVESGSRDW